MDREPIHHKDEDEELDRDDELDEDWLPPGSWIGADYSPSVHDALRLAGFPLYFPTRLPPGPVRAEVLFDQGRHVFRVKYHYDEGRFIKLEQRLALLVRLPYQSAKPDGVRAGLANGLAAGRPSGSRPRPQGGSDAGGGRSHLAARPTVSKARFPDARRPP